MNCARTTGSALALLLSIIASAAFAADPLPPDEAIASMKLPAGFRATMFAAEPDVVQPIAFTFDDRGRVWVVECLSYPTWKADGTGSDRVTILEDTDGDGRHDKRTVFFDKGVNLSGIEVGFGGVWLTAVPNLIFIPDRDGNDHPDGPPKVLLDGWDLAAKHNVVGNLAWGPDGWLYGCNGILSNSRVGKPGTPDAKRTFLNCGVWRYHPVRHAFEVVAHGTTNPWGIDWDERGQLFITNCVLKHLFHIAPGGHYVRMFGQDAMPHSYGLIESCADHQHWAGGHWTSSRGAFGPHSDAGGGHAHSGCMVYLGDNWPAEYRGNVFTCNIHGQRLNRDVLVQEGSGYVAQHAADFAFWRDPLFRGVACKYGPDGGVYVSDWSDDGECHDYNEDDCIKTNGRIYKIVYEADNAEKPVGNALGGVPESNFAKLSDAELAELQAPQNTNEWLVRHARRLLQERSAAGKLAAGIAERFKQAAIAEPAADAGAEDRHAMTFAAIRAVHTLAALGKWDDATLLAAIQHRDPTVAGLAMLAAIDGRQPTAKMLEAMVRIAGQSGTRGPVWRLHLASALQKLPLDSRWPIVRPLLAHPGDADDPNLPHLYWYALEPLVAAQPRQALALLPAVQVPLVRQHLTLRLMAIHDGDGKPNASNAWVLDELVRTFIDTKDEAVRLDILLALSQSYRGRRGLQAPRLWSEAFAIAKRSENPRLRDEIDWLSILYGDRERIVALQAELVSPQGDVRRQIRILQMLDTLREPAFGKILLALVRNERTAVRGEAIRALAAYDEAETPVLLRKLYRDLSADERQHALQTLTARPKYGLELLAAVERQEIPRDDVSALIIRQLQALDDAEVSARLNQVWGEIRPPAADKQQRIAALKEQLREDGSQPPDLSRGRLLFSKHCGTCHKLFDDGSKIGPELTGAQRTSLDYVLDNVLDPSAIVPREYKVTVLRLADGRVVQGVVTSETAETIAVQTQNDLVYVPAAEIEARKESPHSMMPEGLFDRLALDEIRDLVAYLASPTQVPLPAPAAGQ